MRKATVIQRLSKLKPILAPYGVTKLGLFGSTVRGEQKRGSDIDLLIDFHLEQTRTFYTKKSSYPILTNIMRILSHQL